MQEVDVADDRVDVVAPGVRRGDAVDPEPAVLVQRDAHDVRVPGADGRDGGRVAGAVEDVIALDAGVLRAGAVDTVQVDGHAGVEDLVARDVQARTAVDGAGERALGGAGPLTGGRGGCAADHARGVPRHRGGASPPVAGDDLHAHAPADVAVPQHVGRPAGRRAAQL